MPRALHWPRRALPGVLALTLALAPAAGLAGTVSISVTQTTELRDERIHVQVSVRNSGDEAAEDVTPHLAFLGRTLRGEPEAFLEPNETIERTLVLPAEGVGTGSWPFELGVDYRDASQFQFENLRLWSLVVGDPPPPDVSIGELGELRLDGSGSLVVRVENTGAAQRRLTLRVLAPAGLAVDHPDDPIVLGPGESTTLSARIERRDVLPGARLPVFVSVEYEDGAVHQSVAAEGVVFVVDHRPLLAPESLLLGMAAALLLLGAAVSLAGRVASFRLPAAWDAERLGRVGADVVLLTGITLYLLVQLDPRLVLSVTTITGGDTPSHFHPAQHMLEVLLPQGRLIGWDMGNYAGYPLFQFYFPLPFALMALLAQVMPLEVAFKVVTVLGPLTLPLATYFSFRALDYPFPVPALAAGLVLPFLFQEGNSMWGGNVPSMLAGEFCHAVGLTLAVVSLGSIHRGLESGRGWVDNGLLLAACSLAHTYAFLFAALGALALLLERRSFGRDLQYLAKANAFAFCAMGFWAIPLLEKVDLTTAWVYVWKIRSLSELVPQVMLPLTVGGLLGALATGLGLRAPRGSHARLFLIVLLGSLVFYVGAPAIDLVDVRFVPGAQLVLAFLTADLLGLVLRRAPLRGALASLMVGAAIFWTDLHVGAVPAWVRWNYDGFERKPAWPTFQALNGFLAGDYGDPRVAYEFSPRTNMFGSVRAFESIPHFTGRQTLEGTLIHSAINAPFIYYLQSEISEVSTHPIPGYSYSIFDLERGTAHLRMFNVSQVIAVSDLAVGEYQRSPDYEEVFRSGPYRVFHLRSSPEAYVGVPEHWPVLFQTEDWRRSFYAWFKRAELLDVPLVPSELVPREHHDVFELRAASLDALPRRPVEGSCEIDERIEQAAVHFTTSCPGLPHLVRISWFPNWRVEGADRIHPVSPAFMLVFPEGREVSLVYGRTPGDWLGLALSAGALTLAVALLLTGPWRRRRGAAAGWPRTRSDAVFAFLGARRWILLAPLALVTLVLVGGGVSERLDRELPQRLYEAAWDHHQAGEYEEAIRDFRKLIDSEHGYWLEGAARLYAGYGYLQLQKPDEAAVLLEGLVEEYPDSPFLPEALYHLGTARYQQGALPRAAATWRRIVHKYPDMRWAEYSADRLRDMGETP